MKCFLSHWEKLNISAISLQYCCYKNKIKLYARYLYSRF